MWTKGTIPKVWWRAGSVVLPKERTSSNIKQFQQINHLNVEGKIFFSVVTQRIAKYLKQNNLIHTTVQKVGIPDFSGCLEYTIHKHHMAPNPICETGRKGSACPIPGPSQYIWICLPLSYLGSLWLLSCAKEHHRAGLELLPGFAILHNNNRIHNIMATTASGGNGGMYHLPTSLHHGSGIEEAYE